MTENRKIKTIFLNGKAVGEYESSGNPETDIQIVQTYLKDKELWKESSVVDSMYQQANSFAATAKDLYERDLRTTPIKSMWSITPFIVNAAFGAEMYLKTMHKIGEKDVRGHDLLDLYNSLLDEQKAIIQRSAQDIRRNYKLEDGVDIVSCISDLRQAFVEWRYFYQSENLKGTEFQSVRFTMHVLHEAYCRLREMANLDTQKRNSKS